MREEVKKLIKESKSIAKNKKALYLKMADLIDDQKLSELFAILEQEKNETEKINGQANKDKSEINKKYIEEIDKTFKQGQKNAIEEEESEDKLKADEIINQIDDS